MDHLEISEGTPIAKSNGKKETRKLETAPVLPMCLQPKEAYVMDYKVPLDLAKQQRDVFWTPEEVEVSKDVHSISVDCTESEKHAVTTGLRIFTNYELKIGVEHWGQYIIQKFPRPDIIQMASCFSFMEINVHAIFYSKINDCLNLGTEEFYLSYSNDPVLKSRMDFIDQSLDSENTLLSIGTFAMIEGAVLYSNFAFFKHFQANGKNKLSKIVEGINFSVRDEHLHHLGGAWLFRTLKEESKLSKSEELKLEKQVYKNALKIREHEFRIVDMLFEKGPIEGITAEDLKTFVESRINLCLTNLGLSELFDISGKENPIAVWFYKNISSYVIHDFFAKVGNQYRRGHNFKHIRFGLSEEN